VEIAAESLIVWRLLLITSMVLIVYEMAKWFSARATSLEPWFDLPRIQPSPEEVEALTTLVRSSYVDMMAYSELKQRVYDDITDALALILGLDEDELRKLALDGNFVKQVFGPYASLVSHLSKNRIEGIPTPTTGRREFTARTERETFLQDTNLLLEQVKRWEKHEGQRSLRNR
jgi:hypothetical protein